MLFRSDRKSTRLNSSHLVISYAVFCLKKKKATRLLTRADFQNRLWREWEHRWKSAFHLCLFFFFLMIRRPPRSTLFLYPTLFRSYSRCPYSGSRPASVRAPLSPAARRLERECVSWLRKPPYHETSADWRSEERRVGK